MQIFPFHHHYIAATKPTEGSDRGVCRAIAGQPSRRSGMSPPTLIVSKNTVQRLHSGWKNTPRRDVKADGTEERPAESIDNCGKNLRKRTFEINSKQILYYDETERNQ